MYADLSHHLFDYLERVSSILRDADVDQLVHHDEQVAAREAASIGVRLPLAGLRARAQLDVPAMHVLVLAAASGLDVGLGELLAARLAGRTTPTVQEVITLLAFAAEDEAPLLAAFAPDAPLRAYGLVHLGDERRPLLHRTVHVDDRVIAFLRGDDVLDPELSDLATLATTAPAGAAADTIERLLDTPGPIVVDGAARVGKTSSVIAAAARRGRRTLVVDVERVLGDGALALLDGLRREAMLLDALLVLRVAACEPNAQVMRRIVDFVQRGIAIVTVHAGDAIARALHGPRRVRVENPPCGEQLAIWRSVLGERAPVERVCERYPLPPGDILAAAAAARAHGEVHGRALAEPDVLAAARGRLAHRLGEVAELVDTTLTWDDLVVREEVVTRLVEIVAAVRYREQVMEQWGFSSKLPYGRSLSVLFSGPPGTGKTMAATLIGKELGLEIFRVDLSKIVSKYVGETEKNLARVFEGATRCRAVILFDEADSLFAKRTEVKTSNDRYANLEVNFLLQRLEAHDGIVILTTNAANAIDPAFLRRIRYRVEFPEPDETERKGLWRSMVPARTPLAPDVDFAALGRKFRLTGGHIKNAVVRAAFLAAGEGHASITQDMLVRAALLEWTELGNLPGV